MSYVVTADGFFSEGLRFWWFLNAVDNLWINMLVSDYASGKGKIELKEETGCL